MKQLLAVACLLAVSLPAAAGLPTRDVTGLDPAAIARLELEAAAHSWWVRTGNTLHSPAFAGAGEAVDADPANYRFAVGAKLPFALEWARVGGGSGLHILYFTDTPPRGVERDVLCRGAWDGRLHEIEPGIQWAVPVQPRATAARATGLTVPEVQALVDQVDQNRYFNDIATLTAFGSRNTHNVGNVNARNWLEGQFAAMGLATATPQLTVSGTPTRNVVGTLTGSMFPDEFLVVGAHFDSLPSSGNAPGAEDNASGTAAVLEMARILAPFGSQRTIHFIAFTGEEQGLRGSADWVGDLTATQRSNFEGAVIMDMISYTGDSERDVLLETSSWAAPLLNELADAAADFTTLSVYTSFFPFGSDHVPFLNANLPAVLTIENDWDTFPAYHQSTDTTAFITRDLGASITKMNLAAVARLANPQPLNSGLGDAWMILGR